MSEKKVITWKDADQNLCMIAAYVLNEAMGILRDPVDMERTDYPSEDGPIPRGFLSENPNQTIFADFNFGNAVKHKLASNSDYGTDWHENESGSTGDLDADSWLQQVAGMQEGDFSLLEFTGGVVDGIAFEMTNFLHDVEGNITDTAVGMPPQCWYSFQNIVRMRLAEFRREIYLNCYNRKPREQKRTKNKSRNSGKRQPYSKTGREPERS